MCPACFPILVQEAKSIGDEFLQLEKYVNLNYMGFHKILVSWDSTRYWWAGWGGPWAGHAQGAARGPATAQSSCCWRPVCGHTHVWPSRLHANRPQGAPAGASRYHQGGSHSVPLGPSGTGLYRASFLGVHSLGHAPASHAVASTSPSPAAACPPACRRSTTRCCRTPPAASSTSPTSTTSPGCRWAAGGRGEAG